MTAITRMAIAAMQRRLGHDYPAEPAVNAGAHVLRGGSWYNVPAGLRAAIRLGLDPRDRCLIFGFPVARALG